MNSERYTPESPTEQSVWNAMNDLNMPSPSASLRQGFYQRMRRRERWRSWFSLQTLGPAFAMLLVGVLVGQSLPPGADAQSVANHGRDEQIEVLSARVASLSHSVALALLDHESASERLRGVRVASELESPGGVTDLLLRTAAQDPVTSVRSAAVDALGPRVAEPEVGDEVFRLLLDSGQPLVQLSFADLIMRWGTDAQLLQLIDAARGGQLTDEVATFVLDRVVEQTEDPRV